MREIKFSLKDVIQLVGGVLLLAGTYTAMQYKITNLEQRVAKIEQANPEVLDIRLKGIEKQLDDMNKRKFWEDRRREDK